MYMVVVFLLTVSSTSFASDLSLKLEERGSGIAVTIENRGVDTVSIYGNLGYGDEFSIAPVYFKVIDQNAIEVTFKYHVSMSEPDVMDYVKLKPGESYTEVIRKKGLKFFYKLAAGRYRVSATYQDKILLISQVFSEQLTSNEIEVLFE